MKKFILEKNFSTGMTVHPLSSPTQPSAIPNIPQLPSSSSSSSPSSSSTTVTTTSIPSLSPNINSLPTNGFINNTNSSTIHKHHRGVNSNQLIHPSAANPINSIGNHNDSGFQPYRGSVPANSSSSLEDGLLTSVQQQSSTGPSSDNPGSSSSSSAAAASNLANHILPYSERLRSAAVAAGYSYNPFIGPPSHANPSASMPPSQTSQPPHHSLSTHPLPPQPYRIDDPIYLERYGLMRSTSNNLHQTSTVQSLSHSDLSPGHNSTNSNVPSYQMSSRYSELLATHQERVLNEEKQRLLGHGSNSSHLSSHPHPQQHQHQSQHPPVSSSGPTNYKIHSATSDHGSRSREYPNNGNVLSGMASREMNTSSNVNKKHQPNGSVTISNPGSRPMNLTSNASGVNQTPKNNNTSAILIDLKKEHPPQHASQHFGPSSSQTTITFTNSPVTTTSSSTVNNHLWRPQISERDDSRHHINPSAHNSRLFPDNVKRNVAFEVPIDYSSSKKQRFSDLPGDLSYKSSPSIEHQSESFISSNHSPFFMNSAQDLHVHLLKSRPPPQSSSLSSSQAPQQQHQQQQQQQPTSPPLRQIHFNNNITQSKKLNEVAPQCRQPLKAQQSPQPQIQLNKDQFPQKSDENLEKVISKLDLMEMKLKLKRRERAERAVSRGSVETSEDEDELIYSEEEISDEEENELKKARFRCKYMITSGPPAKLDDRPEKVDFLRSLGLVTLQTRNDILFEKYVSRRRFKSKSDANPFVSTNVPKPELFDSENVFLQPTDILPNSLFKSETRIEDKFNYMNLLGLKHELNADEIKKREQIWEGVLEERDRRRSINLSYGKITNNLTKEALEKWFQYLTTQPRVYNNDRYNKNNGYLNNNLNHKTSSTGSSFTSSPSLESNSTLSPVNNSWHSQRRTLNVTSDRKQSKQSKNISKQKGLLQSLDNREISSYKSLKTNNVEDKKKDDLLLIPSSSTRLNNKHKSDNLLNADPDHRESKDSEASCHNETTSKGFKWPGIEAIIHAYEKYAIEAGEEKESLNLRIGQLKLTIREKTNAVDKLSKRLSSLTKVQKEMDEESEQYERRINSIKKHLNEIVS